MSMREIKLCLLGDSGVGKSSLVLRFVSDTFNERAETTIGASFMSKTLIVDDRSFKYQIWDTAGQEKYRGLAPMYYRGAAAAIVVYDVTKMDTFKTLKSWIKELQQLGPRDIVIAVAGNKCDLEEMREVPTKEAIAYAESIGAVFSETSAKTAINVKDIFVRICQRLPSEMMASLDQHQTITLHNEPDKKKKGCC
eukprot:m.7189 g.7189  ORF g.7189 m.7189 type:complete len:195 (+) comp17966_c0_seq1:115-699(+)